jgi:DnaA-homolog protein
MSAQLALNLRLKDSASFANFYPARNAEAVDCLCRALESLQRGKSSERVIYLWGPSGSGRTHLLQAVSHRAQSAALPFSYVPLFDVRRLSPSVLDGLEAVQLVCVDDLQAIAGVRAWEEAVFTLIERLTTRGGLFVASADAPAAQLSLTLPDLVTRLTWGPVYSLQSLSDEEKLAALQLRAGRLGLELPLEVARYVLARYPRDVVSLFSWLDRMDRHSLVAKRRITIPFLRELERATRD